MTPYQVRMEEIEKSNLIIELDLPAQDVLLIAVILADLKADNPEHPTTEKFNELMNKLLSSLDYDFPGTHSLLFPDIEIVNKEIESL
jgi:hypothetical protein